MKKTRFFNALSQGRDLLQKTWSSSLKLFLFILTGMTLNSSFANSVFTASLSHGGNTYVYDNTVVSAETISICNQGTFTINVQDINNSNTQYALLLVSDPSNPCISQYGNSGQEIIAPGNLVLFNSTGNQNFTISYNTAAGGAYQDYHIVAMTAGSNLSASDYLVGACHQFTYSYIIRVYPNSTNLDATYNVTMNSTNTYPATISANSTGSGVTHAWYWEYSDGSNSYTVINGWTSPNIAWSQLAPNAGIDINKCFKLKHVISTPCGSAEYVEEFCYNSCEVYAGFSHQVMCNDDGTADVTVYPDVDANNPSLASYTSEWTVTITEPGGSPITTTYNSNVPNIPPVPNGSIVEIEHHVIGYDNNGNTYSYCEDTYTKTFTIEGCQTDCRKFALENHSTLDLMPNSPYFAINPFVAYTGSGGVVNANATTIVDVTVNGTSVIWNLSIPGTGSSIAYLPANLISDGDQVCIYLEYQGCHARRCITWRKSNGTDCRELNLLSHTTFEQIPPAPSAATTIRIVPTISFNGSGGQVVLPCSAVSELSVNNVVYPPGIATYACPGNNIVPLNFNASAAGLQDGDIICVKIVYQGCEVESCYRYTTERSRTRSAEATTGTDTNSDLNQSLSMQKNGDDFEMIWSNETIIINAIQDNAIINDLMIIDYLGQVVYQNQSIRSGQHQLELNGLSLAQGAYIVVVNQKQYKKIIIQ